MYVCMYVQATTTTRNKLLCYSKKPTQSTAALHKMRPYSLYPNDLMRSASLSSRTWTEIMQWQQRCLVYWFVATHTTLVETTHTHIQETTKKCCSVVIKSNSKNKQNHKQLTQVATQKPATERLPYFISPKASDCCVSACRLCVVWSFDRR